MEKEEFTGQVVVAANEGFKNQPMNQTEVIAWWKELRHMEVAPVVETVRFLAGKQDFRPLASDLRRIVGHRHSKSVTDVRLENERRVFAENSEEKSRIEILLSEIPIEDQIEHVHSYCRSGNMVSKFVKRIPEDGNLNKFQQAIVYERVRMGIHPTEESHYMTGRSGHLTMIKGMHPKAGVL